jgi:tetratricopeptide (TPR) repeat protein
MERAKSKIILFILFLACMPDAISSYRSEIYDCYISGNMAKWKIVMDKMATEKSLDPDIILELVNYQYGYIGWAIGNKRASEAKQYLEQAEENLDRLGSCKSCSSMVNAYRSAFYGYKIGLNKVLAPFLGGKSLDCARAAIRQDDRNFLAYVQLGNAEFYMPAAFGGSKSKALEYFRRAQELMESDPVSTKQNWNYLNLLVLIAQSYMYTKEFEKSKQYLDKLLVLEPGFTWVKNDLYQQLNNKMKN